MASNYKRKDEHQDATFIEVLTVIIGVALFFFV